MVLAEGEQPFVPHPAQLLGEGAAVKVEVVGQLLAVEGKVELHAARLNGLAGQVGQQPPPHGLGGGAEDAAGEGKVLFHGDTEQVPQQAVLPAVFGVGAGKGSRVQKQHLAVCRREDIHHQRLPAERIGLGKGLPLAHLAEDAFAAPEVDALDVDGTPQHDADLMHGVAGVEDGLAAGKGFPPQAAVVLHLVDVGLGQALKQKNRVIVHKNPSLWLQQPNLCCHYSILCTEKARRIPL